MSLPNSEARDLRSLSSGRGRSGGHFGAIVLLGLYGAVIGALAIAILSCSPKSPGQGGRPNIRALSTLHDEWARNLFASIDE